MMFDRDEDRTLQIRQHDSAKYGPLESTDTIWQKSQYKYQEMLN